MRCKTCVRVLSSLIFFLLVGQLAMAQSEPTKSKLSRKTIQQLDETVLPAYRAGDLDGFLISLAPLIDKLNVDEYDALEDYGQSHQIESLRGAFAQGVLESIEQGRKLDIDVTRPDLALFLLAGMADHIQAKLSEITGAPEMASQIDAPSEWVEREKIYWNIHVFRNEFLNLERLAAYAGGLAKSQLKLRKNYQDSVRKERLQTLTALPQQVQSSYVKLLNNEAMMRLDELLLAEEVLRHTLNFSDRLHAAYALEDNGRSILKFLENIPTEQVAFDPLKKEGLSEQVQQLLASGRAAGKDVLEKALLLRTGTHWWLRGRYGIGPLNAGLLKAPEAVASPDAMVGLYMPKLPHKPISNYLPIEVGEPGYERRHHYAWAVEYRGRVHKSGSVTSPQYLSRAVDGYFW